MRNNFSELKSIVRKAIECFNQKDKYLLQNNVNERSWYSQMGIYLIENLAGTGYNNYTFDCEYNRGCNLHDDAIKQLDDKNISIELVIHKRGHDEIVGCDNLMCVEFKKSTNLGDLRNDIDRLEKLTSMDYKFNYKLCVMIIANMEKCRLEVNKFFYASLVFTMCCCSILLYSKRTLRFFKISEVNNA